MKPSVFLTLGLCVASAVIGFGAYTLLSKPVPVPSAPEQTNVAPVTTAMADIQLTQLDGQTVTLDQWKGQWRLINFWASWCPPCLKEIPLLVDAQQRWQTRNLQILGPAMDPQDRAAALTERFAVNYPVFYGNQDISAAATALGDTLGALPYSVLVDPEGTVRFQKHGEFDAVELEQLLKTYLGTQ